MIGTIIAIGAGVAVFTGIGAGIGIGIATGKAADAIARQPEAESKISKTLILGCALAEATAIYGFIIALLIIFFLKYGAVFKRQQLREKGRYKTVLRLDFNLVLEMINLVVLFLILRKFCSPGMNIMEKRKAMIAEGLKNADEQQEAARELKKQYEDALSGAKDESLRMIEQAKLDARTEYDRILKEADAQAGKLLVTARETIDLEREQTLRDMKSQVARAGHGSCKEACNAAVPGR